MRLFQEILTANPPNSQWWAPPSAPSRGGPSSGQGSSEPNDSERDFGEGNGKPRRGDARLVPRDGFRCLADDVDDLQKR